MIDEMLRERGFETQTETLSIKKSGKISPSIAAERRAEKHEALLEKTAAWREDSMMVLSVEEQRQQARIIQRFNMPMVKSSDRDEHMKPAAVLQRMKDSNSGKMSPESELTDSPSFTAGFMPMRGLYLESLEKLKKLRRKTINRAPIMPKFDMEARLQKRDIHALSAFGIALLAFVLTQLPFVYEQVWSQTSLQDDHTLQLTLRVLVCCGPLCNVLVFTLSSINYRNAYRNQMRDLHDKLMRRGPPNVFGPQKKEEMKLAKSLAAMAANTKMPTTVKNVTASVSGDSEV
jgi:hypothetical protein